jgi:diguanylate cyclase (GGDEF)-like protein/PAS domain S-box-containing protein
MRTLLALGESVSARESAVPASLSPTIRPTPSTTRTGSEVERVAAVAKLGLLDGGRELAFDRVARLAARAVRTPFALLVFQGDRRAVLRGAAHLVEPGFSGWTVPHAAVHTVVESDEPVAVDSVDPQGPEDPGLAALGARAWAGVPVRDRAGNVLGALIGVDSNPRRWTDEDLQALDDVTLALLPELEARAAAGALDLDAAALLGRRSPGGIPDALAHALHTERTHLTTLLDAMADGVLLVGNEESVIHCNKAFLGLFGLLSAPSLVGQAAAIACQRYREQFLEPDRFGDRVTELKQQRTASFREMLPMADGRVLERDYVPVAAQGKDLGHLWIYRDVTERERARSSLGQQRDNGSLSHVDELTGLHNRRGFIDLARAQLDEAVRAQRAMLVIFVDLDGLKQINDRFGHQAGDRALFEFAALLRATFRERDLVARLGGDEFVVLVTDAAGVGATELVARLSIRVEQHNGRGRRDFSIAFSNGVSTFDPAEPEPLEVLLSQADARMYAQKRLRKDEPGT